MSALFHQIAQIEHTWTLVGDAAFDETLLPRRAHVQSSIFPKQELFSFRLQLVHFDFLKTAVLCLKSDFTLHPNASGYDTASNNERRFTALISINGKYVANKSISSRNGVEHLVLHKFSDFDFTKTNVIKIAIKTVACLTDDLIWQMHASQSTTILPLNLWKNRAEWNDTDDERECAQPTESTYCACIILPN